MKRVFLTCKSDHVLAEYRSAGSCRPKTAKVKEFDELIAFLRKHNVHMTISSSTMDFPEEETNNLEVIALCNRIRNGDEGGS
jgi:hypothetical protein